LVSDVAIADLKPRKRLYPENYTTPDCGSTLPNVAMHGLATGLKDRSWGPPGLFRL
jgi:hypothetical protein